MFGARSHGYWTDGEALAAERRLDEATKLSFDHEVAKVRELEFDKLKARVTDLERQIEALKSHR